MEIIPVIDVMGEKVVHASGDERSDYPLLTSVLTQSHQPLEVVKDLLAYYPFLTIYIADLDAIMLGERNNDLYNELSQTFPEINFYLDAGVTDRSSWQSLAVNSNIYPVIGSETLVDISCLHDSEVKKNSILSLDFKRGEFLGDKNLLTSPNLWPEQLIAMNLDCIGAQLGPDLVLLEALKNTSNRDIIAAGGVRSKQDLMLLKQKGIERVLIASALHDGRVDKQILNTI
ncbi:MAG: HisA/HisF-related TIM barrel protein [Gammaproteobacteria bacterium]|nr:HisA/HisF-related TIM barrel protein [Gammaproteobacteria bacterium]